MTEPMNIELVLDADGVVINAVVPDPDGKWTPPEGATSLRNPPPGVGIGHRRDPQGKWQRPTPPVETGPPAEPGAP